MFEPYPMPQDYGARSDCKYAEFTNSEGKGIRVEGNFIFTIREYTDTEIQVAKHPNELVANDFLTLHIDKCQRGVGSGACGPDTLPEYKIVPKPFELCLIIKAI